MATRSDSTVEDLLEEQRDVNGLLAKLRRRRLARRGMLAVLAVVVVAALIGAFGDRTAEVHAAAAGSTLVVRYPSIVRAGPPASLDISVQQASGFDGPVEIAIDAGYLSALEQRDVSPRPESERAEKDLVVWTFAPPVGDHLAVEVSAQMSSQARFGQDGHIAVREGGRTVVEVGFTTWVWP